MPRRWDDWKCYRCQKWYGVSLPRVEQETPAGFVVALCRPCVVIEHTTTRHAQPRVDCPLCEDRVPLIVIPSGQ